MKRLALVAVMAVAVMTNGCATMQPQPCSQPRTLAGSEWIVRNPNSDVTLTLEFTGESSRATLYMLSSEIPMEGTLEDSALRLNGGVAVIEAKEFGCAEFRGTMTLTARGRIVDAPITMRRIAP